MKILTLKNDTLTPSSLPCFSLGAVKTASREVGLSLLEKFDVALYAKSRNSLGGGISRLSIYVEHGLIDREDFLEHIDKTESQRVAEPLLKQLYWREFFLQTYEQDRAKIWQDYEPYKTGFCADEYADLLPQDIQNAQTHIPLIDMIVRELKETHYLHNHARLYLASYIVHFRRVKWQAGAVWMLEYLGDGNLAVNNLSWQWVASTRSDKPYIFNWENISKFAASYYALKREDHTLFDASYEELSKKLFKPESC